MKSTRWFALSAVGVLLAVSPVACGSGGKGGSKTTGAGGAQGAAGTGGAAAGQGGNSGAAGQSGAGGGQAGAGGGQAGAGAGGFSFDGGFGGFNFDGGTNFDAILADILGNLGDGRGVDAVGFNLPACAAGVDNGVACVANDKPCKPATGQACLCGSNRNNDRAWVCF